MLLLIRTAEETPPYLLLLMMGSSVGTLFSLERPSSAPTAMGVPYFLTL